MPDAINTGPTANADVQKAGDDEPKLAIELAATGLGSESWWRDQVTQAGKRRKKELTLWKANLSRYGGGKPKLPGMAPGDTTAVNVDFYNTEQKKAQLFYQQPDVQLAPKDGQGAEVSALFQKVLNYYLGKDEIDVEDMMDEALVDMLVPAGYIATKIGFEEVKQDVMVASRRLDPATGQAALDPKTGQPEMTATPTRIWSRYFWERISPSKLLIPSNWTSVRYDKAPWLGFEFDLDADMGAREFKVSRGFLGEASDAEDSLVAEHDKEFKKSSGKGVEIWYRASLYDPKVKNPDLFRRLVIVEGKRQKRVVVHEDSPYQRFAPNGRFLQGMRGNPIHVGALRSMTDTAYPPSDCSISRNQVDELSAGRSQMTTQRRRNLPMRGVDRTKIDKMELDKLERAEVQGLLPVDGDPDQIIKVIANAQLPRENFDFNSIIQQDIDRMWALGANQQSTTASGGRTATELSLIQKATDTRMTKERGRVLAWYVKGVEKLSTLLQLFGDEEQLVPILGQDGTTTMMAWDKTKIPGRFLFTARPDSSIRTDAAEELERSLRSYNLMARDPHVNRIELLRPILVKLGYDPAKVLIEKVPDAKPEPPKPNVSFKAEDLVLPSVIEYLGQMGITITPVGAVVPGRAGAAAQLARQMPHPGAVDRQPPIDKHEADLTGQPSGPRPM